MSFNKLKLPFALNEEGQLVQVSEVENGLSCKCTCPKCGHPLVAKNRGKKTIPHFAHYKSSECAHAVETAIHYAAKEILFKHKKLVVPEVKFVMETNAHKTVVLYKEQEVKFLDVRLEKKISDIIPDVILVTQNGKELLLEIAVTHFVDKEKAEKVRRLGKSMVQIDISKIDRAISLDVLEEEIMHKTDNREWIFNKKRHAFKWELKMLGKFRQVTSKGFVSRVYHCPLKAKVWNHKPYANLVDDCWQCLYHLDTKHNKHGGATQVLCGGGAKSAIDELITKRSDI